MGAVLELFMARVFGDLPNYPSVFFPSVENGKMENKKKKEVGGGGGEKGRELCGWWG